MTNVVPIRALSQTLVDQFVTLAVEHGIAVANYDSCEANRLFDQLAVIENKLVARGDKGLLAPLLQHPDPWVRLVAAKKMMAEAPQLARQILEELKASKIMPASFDAAMSIRFIDDGIWVPK